MVNSLRHGTELRRFGRNRLTRLALVVVAAIPLLYGALYLWAFWNPTDHLDRLPVALVVQDAGATTSDGTAVHAGTQVADELVRSDTVHWDRTTAGHAESGLADGDYLAVVTIPRNFSAAVVSAAGEHPEQAPFQVRYNDANGYTGRTVLASVMREVRTAVSDSLGEQMVDTLLVGFTDIHSHLAEAADGGHQVADGAEQARDGAGRLVEGADSLAAGADSLATGTQKARTGAGSLATGAHTLATGAGTAESGARQLSSGLATLETKTAGLPAATSALASGSRQVADGNRQLADTVGAAADKVDAAADTVTATTGTVTRQRAQFRAQLAAYVAGHPEDSSAAQLLQLMDTDGFDQAAARLQDDVAGLQQSADTARTDTATLASGAEQVAAGNAVLAAQTPALTAGISAAADGAGSLATGTAELSSGATQLAAGADSLSSGLNTLDTGADQLASGAHTLADGVDSLQTGLVSLADGSASLSQGLDDGVAQVPSYTAAERKDTSGVIASPVRLATSFLHEAAGNGEGFAPYFMGLALYVGAMILWMVLRPVSQRLLAAPVAASRVVLAGLQPAALIGLVQSVVLLAVLVFALGLSPNHVLATLGFTVLISLAFITLQQAIGIAFGAVGRVLVLVLLMLQLTSAGGTYPANLSPTFFQRLHEVLPLTQVVNGLREAITGSLDGRFWTAVVYLVVLTVVSLLAGIGAASRNRIWTMSRLHPAISL